MSSDPHDQSAALLQFKMNLINWNSVRTSLLDYLPLPPRRPDFIPPSKQTRRRLRALIPTLLEWKRKQPKTNHRFLNLFLDVYRDGSAASMGAPSNPRPKVRWWVCEVYLAREEGETQGSYGASRCATLEEGKTMDACSRVSQPQLGLRSTPSVLTQLSLFVFKPSAARSGTAQRVRLARKLHPTACAAIG